MRSSFIVPLLASLSLAGCATLSAPPPAAIPGPAPAAAVAVQTPAANDALNATVWFQASVERDLVFREVYRAAAEHLAAALKDRSWDALPKEDRSTSARSLPPAIIFDVDETLLDNSPSQVRQIRGGTEFDEANWGAWVNERKAKALPGALDLARAADARGITVFYISNRDASLADATVDNLRRAGFPIKDASQFLGLGSFVEGCEQEGSEKSCRRQLVGRKYRVLMQFGDQLGDFVRIVANTPDGRRQAVEPYAAWIGQRWWVLPNPMYGSWEPALFNNAWNQPAMERRRAKQDALDAAP